eukprot:5606615-Ditylum_brightwellii.AAC.1
MMVKAVQFIMDHNPLKQRHYDGIELIDPCGPDLTNFHFLWTVKLHGEGYGSLQRKKFMLQMNHQK